MISVIVIGACGSGTADIAHHICLSGGTIIVDNTCSDATSTIAPAPLFPLEYQNVGSLEQIAVELDAMSGWREKIYRAQWVLRDKPYKYSIKTIKRNQLKIDRRRVLRCNRKGIGLRMRMAS